MGYLAPCAFARRSPLVRISLTEKGREHRTTSCARFYEKHSRTIQPIGGISDEDFERLNTALNRLERFLDRPDPLPPLIQASLTAGVLSGG